VLFLLLILIVTAVSLTVILWAGTFFFQGYIYTEPSPSLYWQAPAAAALLSLGFTIWVFAMALSSTATPQNLPIDTIFRFSPKEDMAELKGKPAEKLWAIKSDRKKTGPDKDGESVPYKRKRDERGRFVYKDTTSRERPWQRQDVIALEIEKPDGARMRFDLAPTEVGDYRQFVSKEGWVIREYEEGPTGVPIRFFFSRLMLNLLFNLFHFVGWFLALWVILRFQWTHALGLAIVLWLVCTLSVLPMLLGYAGNVAVSRQTSRSALFRNQREPYFSLRPGEGRRAREEFLVYWKNIVAPASAPEKRGKAKLSKGELG
jgi:hypothetical protein